MIDLEITKACAMQMFSPDDIYPSHGTLFFRSGLAYDPLHDDAQAMALVKKLSLSVTAGGIKKWTVHFGCDPTVRAVSSDDLNRAICECVARMKK
jgi:hypothetical protein